MNKIIWFTALAGIVTVSLFSGCRQESKEPAKQAQEKYSEANQKNEGAAKNTDSEVKARVSAEWQAFKKESESSIADMEKQADSLNAKVAKAERNSKVKLNSELSRLNQNLTKQKAKLKQKDSEFDKDIKNFDNTTEAEYESFKREFRHDMKELEVAFKDLFKDNVN